MYWKVISKPVTVKNPHSLIERRLWFLVCVNISISSVKEK